MKKKILTALCVILICISAVGLANWFLGNPKEVEIDYNNCTVYSKEDIDSAVEVVVKKMNTMKGCVLYSLKFKSSGALDYCRSLNEDADYVECIVFDSVFRSPITGGGAWMPNEIYTWQWYLAREKGGQWELITWGYT